MQKPSCRSHSLHTEAPGTAPDAFGPFRVLHQVGAGALGPVFRAYDAQRERLVAVKVFNLELPPERAHQLVAEFDKLIASGLAHPAIAAPLATGISGASAYLVSDYMPADTLDQAVREFGPAPPGEALQVATQLAGALDFAAVVSVEHGALHPRDVLLSKDETRLTGLGIARALELAGFTPPVRRPYTPPERIAGGTWDRRADIFSLAALVYELLWGRRVAGIGRKFAKEITDLPGGHIQSLRTTFGRGLAEDPGDRYRTALEFVDALKESFPDLTSLLPLAPFAEEDAHVADVPLVAHAAGVADVELLKPTDEPSVSPSPQPTFDDRPLTPGPEPEIPGIPGITIEPPVAMSAMSAVSATSETSGERSSSALWPLAAAVLIGLAFGFAGGYGVGSRNHPASSDAPIEPAAVTAQTTTLRAQPPSSVPPSASASSAVPVGALGSSAKARQVRSPAESPKIAEKPIAPKRIRGRETVHEAAPPPAEPPRLLVRSTPDGARVIVDGRMVGTTPLAVRNLDAGAHRIRVERSGYRSDERGVTLTEAQPAQSMTFALEQAESPVATRGPFQGELRIASRPVGAKVYVDGRLAGTTPLQLTAVAAGEHALRLELDGYRRWSSSVRVVATEQNRITASLER